MEAEKSYAYRIDPDKISLFNGLHCAPIFGIDQIVASLVKVEGCNINQSDCIGNTPLVWAASKEHERVVRILLGRNDVSPSPLDKDDDTPFLLAACFQWARGRSENATRAG